MLSYYQVYDVVTELIAAGADPNSTSANGGAPLFAAVAFQNLGGVCALLDCDKIDLEKGLSGNNASPLSVAGYLSTFAIFKALVDAGANRAYRCEQRPWE